ncbi:Glutathione S-transferase T3 [Gracilariopsis chorda]|uniref:Glutathione S-transferase T3 n=1 Tax=Gracilariopsis chorda TaxID=448386 RepID=A0A2V3IL25_9FLOR|nr:Glutathione S-transferase T3 [Gracilariopsis chorda]|eukprot:PXF42792.1 Glutathione S-transferase T3 [Gracilariopsis chorda]
MPAPVALMRFRGFNYTPVDDSALARAWLLVFEDPVIGSEQKSLDFFKGVSNFFFILKPPTTEMRSTDSLKGRIKLMNKECVKFTGCVAAIRHSKPTGVVDDDIVRIATALYKNIKITSTADNCGKPF